MVRNSARPGDCGSSGKELSKEKVLVKSAPARELLRQGQEDASPSLPPDQPVTPQLPSVCYRFL